MSSNLLSFCTYGSKNQEGERGTHQFVLGGGERERVHGTLDLAWTLDKLDWTTAPTEYLLGLTVNLSSN